MTALEQLRYDSPLHPSFFFHMLNSTSIVALALEETIFDSLRALRWMTRDGYMTCIGGLRNISICESIGASHLNISVFSHRFEVVNTRLRYYTNKKQHCNVFSLLFATVQSIQQPRIKKTLISAFRWFFFHLQYTFQISLNRFVPMDNQMNLHWRC